MKAFCNMVGFPIVKHEAQCLALFCLLEQTQGQEVLGSLRGSFRMLIMMVSLLGVGAELL